MLTFSILKLVIGFVVAGFLAALVPTAFRSARGQPCAEQSIKQTEAFLPAPRLCELPRPALGIRAEKLVQFHYPIPELVQRHPEQRERTAWVQADLHAGLATVVHGP